jgi:signal transduction histidine kinase
VATFRIRDRIVVPFVLIAVVATVAAALVSLSLISNTLEARAESQIARGSAFVSRSQFALSPSVLRLVREIVDADVVTFGPGAAAPVVTTVDATLKPGLVSAVIANEPRELAGAAADAYQLRRMTVDGAPHLVAYRRVAEQPGTVMAFVTETSDVALALRQARLRVLVVAGISLCLFFIVSEIVARRVSGPIERLLAATEASAGSGGSAREPAAGEDEVARLAQVFNDMDDRLRTSQDALVRSEKLAVTGLLAARVAHDVRNPLSSIKMQTQLLRSRLKHDAENQALLRAVLHDVDQVESVVRGLLELARPGELKLQKTVLSEVIDDLLRHVSAQMAHRHIAVEAKIEPGLPTVLLDAERFRQALLNLIANAADAMTDGGTLSVVAVRHQGGSAVVLDVCDDGTGIDPAVADHLFDPFMSTKRDGIGLGLVNTKAIVESHGGSIELSPRDGGGTRARITLPVPPA